MRSGGNSFNYFCSENQLTKFSHLVQFRRVLLSCPDDWARPYVPPPLTYATDPGAFQRCIMYDRHGHLAVT